MRRRTKILISLFSLFVVVALVSLTIGQEILAQQKPSLFSFGIIHFAGYLFFLLMPVESLVPYYLALGHAGITIVIIAVLTAIAAQPINYAIGYLMSADIIKGLIGERKFDRYKKYICEFGPITILIFNLLPLSSSVLSLVAGMLRYRFRRLLLYSFAGLMIKYITLVYLYYKFVG